MHGQESEHALQELEASGPAVHMNPTLLLPTKRPPPMLAKGSGEGGQPSFLGSSRVSELILNPPSTAPPTPHPPSAHLKPSNQQTTLPRLAPPRVPPASPLAPTPLHPLADPPQDTRPPALALLHTCLTPEPPKGS